MNPEEYNEMEQTAGFGGCDDRNDGCATVNYQYANISIPIEVRPKTRVGDITIECCDEPSIECCDCDSKNGLNLVITQKVCVKIPVRYQIEACAGEESISCE
jgi:hypothetical protein